MSQFIEVKPADDLYDKYMDGVRTFYDLLKSRQWLVAVSTSFGKESSVILAMMLEAARLAQRDGVDYCPIIVSHGNTGIENPSLMDQITTEISNVHNFCRTHGIKYKFNLAQPRLFENFVTRIVGGNLLPTYEDGKAQCSMSWKVQPQRRMAKRVEHFAKTQYPNARLCAVTGVRLDESEARRQRIMARGDKHDEPFLYDGNWAISPILHFSEEDVFTFLTRGVKYKTYSSFDSTMAVYAEASGVDALLSVRWLLKKMRVGARGVRPDLAVLVASELAKLTNPCQRCWSWTRTLTCVS